MLQRIVRFAVTYRWLVLVLTLVFVPASLYVALQVPIDAFPDLTNNQVTVITQAPGLSPQEVEQLVTNPLEASLMGLPRTEGIRSASKISLSLITLVFEDNVDLYFARQLVNERLQEARGSLPPGVEPRMGAVATVFGELYQYTIEGPQSLMERKTFQDWTLRRALRTLPGIGQVDSWGGYTRQVTVEVRPEALQRYGLTMHDVLSRLAENNRSFGGGLLEAADEQWSVRGLGRAARLPDLGSIVLKTEHGTPVLVRDVADVADRPLQRQGAILRDGQGETVCGMAIMLKGGNSRQVIDRVKQRLASLTLPPGLSIKPFYDQSEVIDGTIGTVRRNLLEAGALVVVVLLLFLGNLRASLIVAAVIPLSLLFGFVGMAVWGVTANLMSLGAVDFGMIVDGSVVMMENAMRRLSERREGDDPLALVAEAGAEVARPIVFAVAIIVAVYLPIFTLQGLEGRMFRPMAITVCAALVGSLVLALLFVPALAAILLRRDKVAELEARWLTWLRAHYERTLAWVLDHRLPALGTGLLLVVIAVGSLAYIGTEFMPRLDEGSLLITTKKLPGVSLTESIRLSNEVEKVVKTFPEVRGVVTKLGRADLATDSMGVHEGDVYVLLKPIDQWTTAKDKEGLIRAMEERLQRVPGVGYTFTQPMAMRMDETVSGIKGDLAVKIFGENEAELQHLADRVQRVLQEVPGAADVAAEVIAGVGELQVQVDRAALARYGLNVSDVQELVDASTGGVGVSEYIEGDRRFPLAVRLPEHYRRDLTALGELILQAPNGERVPLRQVATLAPRRGPEIVSRENAQRRIVVQSNVRGRDLGSFVAEAQQRIGRAVMMPPGYTLEYGGQFENQERATRRLMVVLPLSLTIILGLLYATFHSARLAALIVTNVPFALVGGIAALWARHLNLNLSASIGFIALFGVAVLNGIVMVSTINHLREGGEDLRHALLHGASLRLRPVLMTALVASLGFLPMALSTGQGAEVQRPLATVVIGGLFTSTLLTLYLLPAMYPWFAGGGKNAHESSQQPEPALVRH